MTGGWCVHDGAFAQKHGLPGNDPSSEWRQVERDLQLVRETGCRYHVCHVSTRESVARIRAAKAEGLRECRKMMTLARAGKLPEGMLSLLRDLGLPPEKATYVCELYDQDGKLLYQVDYRLAGRVLGAPELDSVPMGWGDLWCGQEVYPCKTPGFPEPHFDLEFGLTLPWVMEEPEDCS